jgi:hypothetical protein
MFMQLKESIMKSNNIERINQAVVILRHFVDLSAKLLPFLEEINNKPNPSHLEKEDKEKIIDVYSNYHFDPTTSSMLMNSNILHMIRNAYEKLVASQNANDELQAFHVELNRLRKNWRLIDAN